MAKRAKSAKKRGRKRVAWTKAHERELKTHSKKKTPDFDRQGHEAHGRSPAPEGPRDGALARPPALRLSSGAAVPLAGGTGRQHSRARPASDGAGVLLVCSY